VFYFVDELQPDGTPESVHLLSNDEILVGLRSSQNEADAQLGSGISFASSEGEMSTAFKSFFNNAALSDVAFTFPPDASESPVDDVYGHKVVLAARCSYFKMMFSSGFAENGQTTIPVEGFSRETILHMLEYIYTNEVSLFAHFPLSRAVRASPAPVEDTTESPRYHVSSVASSATAASDAVATGVGKVEPDIADSIELVIQLLVCANKYLLPALQAMCEEVLFCYRTEVLTLQNICQFVQISDKYNAMRLKDACQRYIVENIDLIKGDDKLRREVAGSPELALLLMDAMTSSNGGNSKSSGSDQDSRRHKRARFSFPESESNNSVGYPDDSAGNSP
jgi:hypothetical protein